MHVSRYLWKLLDLGVIPPDVVRYLVILHGLQCERCVREYKASTEGEVGEEVWPRSTPWQPPRAVERQVEELADLSTEEGVAKIRRARTRFRGAAFLIALLRKVRSLKTEEDFSEAKRWTGFLLASAEHTYEKRSMPLKLMARIEAGDLHRRIGDYEEAWRHFGYLEWKELHGEIMSKRDGLQVRDPYIEGLSHLYRARYRVETDDAYGATLHFIQALLHLTFAGAKEEVSQAASEIGALVENDKDLCGDVRFSLLKIDEGLGVVAKGAGGTPR